jgi:1-acyl-sn-glycerol-3-phosphate acyltransferase
VTNARLAIRSAFFWTLSVLHFFPACASIVLLGALVDRRRLDPLLKLFFRNVVRCTGARLVVRHEKGFDPVRTCVFAANHVEIFDPFLVYPAIPQVARGLELETHFRVPVYGWLMKSFGNVPVPATLTREGLERMRARAREAIAVGTSLIVFPEGTRTRSGRVGTFKAGSFRLAIELGVPVVPVSLAGAFQLKRVGDWRLRPSTVVVQLHAPIETKGMTADDARALAERVRGVVTEAVERSATPIAGSSSSGSA